MYNFSSALFWYKFIFMTELIAAECSFVFLLRERSRFFLRAALSVLGMYALTFAVPIFGYNALAVSGLFLVLFVASLGAMAICFKEKFGVILFCGIWSYTVQHFSYLIGNLITTEAGLSSGSVYESTITVYNAGSLLIGTAAFVAVYLVSMFSVRYIFRNMSGIRIHGFMLVVLSILSLVIEIALNAVVVFLQVENMSRTLFALCYVYDMIVCLLTIGLLIFSLWNKSLQHEKAIMELRFGRERESFEIRKDSIDRINIMCHDLKHRIRELGETGYASDKLKKLESAIKSYDAGYRTGNDALDVILSDAGVRCEKNGVQLVCMADGSALASMETDHIYSLFDNAIDNAIDAAEKVSEPEKRYVYVTVSRKGGMVAAHVENCFVNDGRLIFEGGVPLTTRDEPGELHGYGMRSIKHIVESYDGGMAVNVDGDKFTLDIFIPLGNAPNL